MKRNIFFILSGVAGLMFQFSFWRQPIIAQNFEKPKLYVQTGHSSQIKSVAFSPDGKLLASSSAANIKLWDVALGKELNTLEDSSQSDSIMFSPDGKILAAMKLSSLQLWDTFTGRILITLDRDVGLDNWFESMSFSPDTKLLVTGCSDGTVKLWDVTTGKEIRTQKGHSTEVRSVAFSRDGKILASGSAKSENNLWSLTLKLWDAASGRELKTISKNLEFNDSVEAEDTELNSIVFSADGKLLVSITHLGFIEVWDSSAEKKEEEEGADKRFEGSEGVDGFFTAFSRGWKLLATSNPQAGIRLWDIASGEELKVLTGHSSEITAAAFSSDEKLLASGDYGSTIKLWDVATGEELRTLKGNSDFGRESMTFSPDHKTLAVGNSDFTIKLWDFSAGNQLRNLKGHSGFVYSLAFSPDGKILASGSMDTTVKLWDVASGKELRTLRGHSIPVNSVKFSPDGKVLASVSSEIKLWNVAAGTEISTIKGKFFAYYQVAFSPDGKTLANGNPDYSVKLWDVVTGQELKTLQGHTVPVSSLAFSPDGKLLASGAGNELKLWDAASGKELKNFLKPINDGSPIPGLNFYDLVLFSTDGKVLAASAGSYLPLLPIFGEKKDAFADKFTFWDVATGKQIKLEKPPDWIHFSHEKIAVTQIKGKMILAVTGNGQIDLYDAVTGAFYASLVSIDDSDWLTITPEGFFDGTPNAWKQILWRFNNNTFDYAPVETYFNDFFYPNLLPDVLAGRSPQPKAGQELEKIDRRQPKVEIAAIDGQTRAQLNGNASTDRRTATVAVEVTDNHGEKKQPEHSATGGAQDLRLFRNGSLVKVWHGDVFETAKSGCEKVRTKPGEPRRARCPAEVPIAAGANNLTAYAFNTANVKSNDDTARIEGRFPKREGTLYILAIGVNKYANPGYDLRFAVPDILDMQGAIKEQQEKLAQDAKLKQYARTDIITLKDAAATKENILLALGRFSKDAAGKSLPENLCANLSESLCVELKAELAKIKPTEPEDALLIYYAGHGTSAGQRFYLLPHNFTGAGGERSLDEQGVSDVELNERLEKVDAGRLLMVIDACQSGQALGAKAEGRAPMNSKGLAQLAYDKGMLILTAAQSQQAALEAVRIKGREVNHGLLTFALLEAMKSAQADRDANLQLWEREWFDYAVEQVPLLQRAAMTEREVDLKNNLPETKGRSGIYFVGGDKQANPNDRLVQTPRVFYRRETDNRPLIIAQP